MTAPRIFAAALLLLAGCGGGDGDTSLREINGTSLLVKEMGDGPTVIVVHGGPMLDHGYLMPWIEPLADSYHLVFYDQRLSGGSAPIVDSASVNLAAFVEDIEALRQDLGVETVHVMGHSWGGFLASLYGAAHPEHTRSLILLDPMPPTTALWEAEEARLAELDRPEWRAERDSLRALPEFRERNEGVMRQMMQASFRNQMHDPRAVQNLDFSFPSDYDMRAGQFGLLMPELLSYDLRDTLAAITAPSLIVYGDMEPGLELGGPVYEAAMPQARVLVIKDTGHFPFVERPEEFMREVRAFLGAH
jgi:proline iminopeptidase